MPSQDRLPKVLTDEEIEAFLAEFNHRYVTPHRNWLLCRLMLEAGLRSAEVRSLRPAHLDLNTGKLMVREGKGAKDRVLWLNEDLRDAVGQWLERRADWLDEPQDCPWLLPTRHGTKVKGGYLRRMVKRTAKDAGVQEAERVSPHNLRHTAATRLLADGANLRVVQEVLGHASVETTERYTHLVNDEVEAAMKGMARPGDSAA